MRTVFVCTPGYLGRVDGPARCAFWAEDPEAHGFDTARLLSVDLARSPSAAVAGEIGWGDVEVDDCFTGPNGAVSGTTLGPRWPELRLTGAVYLSAGYLAALPGDLRPTAVPEGASGEAHEYQTVAYWPGLSDPRAGLRYAGHHAVIAEERGSLALCAVYPPGRSADPVARPVTMWLDLSSADQCDAGPSSLTTIGVGDAPKTGALFLISGQLPAAPTPEENLS